MTQLNYYLIRSICAAILGLVLIIWPGSVLTYLVTLIGVLFIIPGIIGIAGYFMRDKTNEVLKPIFPFEAAGSILLGTWLVAMPGFFVGMMMSLLGFVLVAIGGSQLYSLWKLRKASVVPAGMFIVPTLIAGVGVWMLMFTTYVAAQIVSIFGVMIFIYAVMELYSWSKYSKLNK